MGVTSKRHHRRIPLIASWALGCGLALTVLFAFLTGTGCAVDYTNPNLPGASVPCNPTTAKIDEFYTILSGEVKNNCIGCHSAASPSGSYGFTVPDSGDAAAKQEAFCYHYSKWEDNTLIDVPTSDSHGGGKIDEANLSSFANWVRNRFK